MDKSNHKREHTLMDQKQIHPCHFHFPMPLRQLLVVTRLVSAGRIMIDATLKTLTKKK